jgi:hypothetical protein
MYSPIESTRIDSSLHISNTCPSKRYKHKLLPETEACLGDGEHGSHHCASRPSCVAVPQMFQQGFDTKPRRGHERKGILVGVNISQDLASMTVNALVHGYHQMLHLSNLPEDEKSISLSVGTACTVMHVHAVDTSAHLVKNNACMM